ncbi:Gfo/Idh/MocA family oxidoreductase [Paenibacillus sp. alder61]|uniref:Gfo/Idh/MocA family oxidoreductase n=1 Tax=Paenibacillus faecis TaxID=862114 RepID=A0A5D0CW81_9BACL|nr:MULTISPECIES: Gfo/Idh/MocA family oxidoreductase [Paenibacillus]MCA1296260.1 Gfo/Idh/MocA family oxidoreductase [Paenibacillus sp. alder61]TYA14206.1 Gfo/Idh/MocA family oxidoreductase [Paenibacillus faecis]
MRYRVALIGGGIIARNHLDAVGRLDKLEAAAVADTDEGKGRALAEEYGISYYRDYREMVLRERPDIAVIALPHYLHAPCAVWCAEQGCHLLLEKPMALNTAQCDDILAAVKHAGVKLMVGHTQHYKPANILAKRLIQSGELGRLLAIHDTRHQYYYRDNRPGWFLEKEKSGGGILMNLGAHSIDKVQWLTDSRVRRVKAKVTYEGPRGDVEGSGCLFLETDSGLCAVILQSGYEGVARDETELIFTRGMAKLVSSEGLWVSVGGKYEQVQPLPEEDPFILQFEDLLRAIELGVEPDSSGEYARSVIAALEAVYTSDRTGVEQDVGP